MEGELSLVQVLLLALLPTLGTVLGVLLAEWRRPPGWLTGGALHMAAGLATAVAAIELIPRSQDRTETWIIAIALLVGACVSLGFYRISLRMQGGANGHSLIWGAYTAIAIDLFSDGLMTGGGSAVEGDLGVLLAASQVVGNLPGGFAITAGFRHAGFDRDKRLKAALSYPIVPVIGAAVGFLALNGAGDMLTGFVLALFAGLLITATVEDLVPEADQLGAPRRISSPSFAVGFVLLLMMSAYLA
ncbi:ZIP family metal transporter [Croceicoccus marinus]|uniref:ZIP family zinc transporter n=1 Tax=Croceicoccus marinus TaxID=450378 RepID=A0A1Z1FB70_9SPHN|nr:hypothetical protein [Croceicoccus marinus]ARU15992.1 hypothetical protein A9D14_07060 [Croceicoccus marinus]